MRRNMYMLEHKNKEQIGKIARVKETQENKNKRNETNRKHYLHN